MGHLRLQGLPRTRRWDKVVEIIMNDGGAPQVAALSLDAANRGFQDVANDDGVTQVVWLLTQLPLAARAPNYVQRLAALGVLVEAEPNLSELAGAITDATDALLRRERVRTDYGEMAQMAAAETFLSILSQRTQSLFGTTAADVKRELGALATKAQFGKLARRFFASLTRRHLMFFLSRELSNHVGADRRFAADGNALSRGMTSPSRSTIC